MKQIQSILWITAIWLLLLTSSCDFIVGVFKSGVYVGVFLVIIVVAIVIWLISKGRRG